MSVLHEIIIGCLAVGSSGFAALKMRRRSDNSDAEKAAFRQRHLTSLIIHATNLGYRVDAGESYFKVYNPLGHGAPIIDIRLDQVEPVTMLAEWALPDINDDIKKMKAEEEAMSNRLRAQNAEARLKGEYDGAKAAAEKLALAEFRTRLPNEPYDVWQARIHPLS